MITRTVYQEGSRMVEIDRMDECLWRVWVSDRNGDYTRAGAITVFRRSLTSAQATARTFLATGKWPR